LLPSLPVDGLKRIASTITRSDSCAVVMLASGDGKGFLVGAAGEMALKEGIDMGRILKEVAERFGGRGGGAAKIAQAGGIPTERIQRALDEGLQRINEVLR